MRQRQQTIALTGGLDLITPSLMIKPGRCVAVANYECEARGYRRIDGYERFDGQAKPSDATYYLIEFDAGTAAILDGETVTGGTSGATGVALADAVLESGTYGGSDATGHVAVIVTSGTFQDDENLLVSASPVVVVNGTPEVRGATDETLDTSYLSAAMEYRRDLIAGPSGSGPIRGIATFMGETYCWRDNAGGTAGIMHKATTAGWVALDFSAIYVMWFNAGTAEFLVGETVTGGTSGGTGVIKRIIIQDGSWTGMDAEGFLIIDTLTGGFLHAEALTTTAGAATSFGPERALTLRPGGKYRSIEANFTGNADDKKLFVANGVGLSFAFDGTYLMPIWTGVGFPYTSDAWGSQEYYPTHVAEHRLHLFLARSTGHMENSSTGEPFQFVAATGAAETALADEVTGMTGNTRDSLIITTRNSINYLVGADATEFDLRSVSESSGAVTDTLQIVGDPMFLDDNGVRDMQASEKFGNWNIGTITQMVEPLIEAKRAKGATVVGSVRVRRKNQYRLFFSDATGIIIYFGRSDPEITIVNLDFTPNVCVSGEDANGDEIILFGQIENLSGGARVYEMDSGVSADGSTIEAFIRFAFINQGSPNIEKRYHRARLEGRIEGKTLSFGITADFSYGSEELPAASETSVLIGGAGGFWDSDKWNEFYWSAPVEGQVFAPLDGIGENVSVAVLSTSPTAKPHNLSAMTINYTPRRQMR